MDFERAKQRKIADEYLYIRVGTEHRRIGICDKL